MKPQIIEYQDEIRRESVYQIRIPYIWILEAKNERWYKLRLMWWLFQLIWAADRGIIGKFARYRRAFPEKNTADGA